LDSLRSLSARYLYQPKVCSIILSFGCLFRTFGIAFINATAVENLPHGLQGLMGLSFSTALVSSVDTALANASQPLVEANAIANTIANNPSIDNFFTVHLGRTNDTAGAESGIFTVGELVAGFEAINAAPQNPQLSPLPSNPDVKSWSVAVEAVIVNGEPFALRSLFNSTPAGQALAVLDTGFSLPIIPAALAQAIFGQIDGALLSADNSTYVVPCAAIPPNVTVVIGYVCPGLCTGARSTMLTRWQRRIVRHSSAGSQLDGNVHS
jgi:saccharopepsin